MRRKQFEPWDNLWYKTSDNHFVADVDIETGTLKDVTGDCSDGGGSAPAPAVASAGGRTMGSPSVRSLIVFNAAAARNPAGHVAWVDAVNGNGLTITEMNYGPGATADNGYRTTGFNKFDTRHIKTGTGLSYILIP